MSPAKIRSLLLCSSLSSLSLLVSACHSEPAVVLPMDPPCVAHSWKTETIDSRTVLSTALALDRGAPVVSYTRPAGDGLADISVARRQTDASWVVTDVTKTGTHEHHTDLVAKDGRLDVVFQDLFDGFLRHAVITADSALTVEDVRDNRARVGGQAGLAIDDTGLPVAAHVDTYNSIDTPFALRTTRFEQPPVTVIPDERPVRSWGLSGPIDLVATRSGLVAAYAFLENTSESTYDVAVVRIGAFDEAHTFVSPPSKRLVTVSPKVLPLASGRLMVAFCGYETVADGGVYRGLEQEDGTWVVEKMATVGDNCMLDAALSPDGEVYVVTGAMTNHQVQLFRGKPDGGWAASDLSLTDADFPALAVGTDGTVHVAYTDAGNKLLLTSGTCAAPVGQ